MEKKRFERIKGYNDILAVLDLENFVSIKKIKNLVRTLNDQQIRNILRALKESDVIEIKEINKGQGGKSGSTRRYYKLSENGFEYKKSIILNFQEKRMSENKDKTSMKKPLLIPVGKSFLNKIESIVKEELEPVIPKDIVKKIYKNVAGRIYDNLRKS